MNSVFNVSPLEDKKLQEYKDMAMKELNKFFEKKWIYNTPKIFVVDDRKTIDLLREEQTKEWVVGWSWGTLAIFILNPKNIDKESCHDGATYDYRKLIKHELCHSFVYMFLGRSNFAWINEGIALYTAQQLDRYPMPKEFDGFLDNKNVYAESGSAFKLLIDNFNKETVFEFYKKQTGIKDEAKLKSVFKKIFNADLSYSFFNELKDKQA